MDSLMVPVEVGVTEPAARKVIILGEVFLYREKAPFEKSGVSVLGAIEYDEAADKIRCHECGAWLRQITNTHLATHGMDASGYKRRHGLRRTAALVSEGTREKRVAITARLIRDGQMQLRQSFAGPRGTPRGPRKELANSRKHCKAQLLSEVRRIGRKLGRTPSAKDLRAAGINANSVVWAFGLPLTEVQRLAGFAPNGNGQNGFKTKGAARQYTQTLLMEMLRDFYVRFGRLPGASDYHRGLLPSPGTWKLHFGSMRQAYVAAGLSSCLVGRWANPRWALTNAPDSTVSEHDEIRSES